MATDTVCYSSVVFVRFFSAMVDSQILPSRWWCFCSLIFGLKFVALGPLGNNENIYVRGQEIGLANLAFHGASELTHRNLHFSLFTTSLSALSTKGGRRYRSSKVVVRQLPLYYQEDLRIRPPPSPSFRRGGRQPQTP